MENLEKLEALVGKSPVAFSFSCIIGQYAEVQRLKERDFNCGQLFNHVARRRVMISVKL